MVARRRLRSSPTLPLAWLGSDTPVRVIEVESLRRSFGRLEAVKGVSFEVHEGELFGFLGPNGAGKTTTINMLCTLLRPTAGTATVNGLDVQRQCSEVRHSIGLVFQQPTVDEYLSDEQNLRFHAYAYGMPAKLRESSASSSPWSSCGTAARPAYAPSRGAFARTGQPEAAIFAFAADELDEANAVFERIAVGIASPVTSESPRSHEDRRQLPRSATGRASVPRQRRRGE